MAGAPWTILNFAFRPFFLLGSLFAVLAMTIWIAAQHGISWWTLPADITSWHAHEMLLGFAGAAVGGFILTAVATWTGRPPVQGPLLGILVVTWFAGRLAMSLSGLLPAITVAVTDLSFPVLLTILAGREIIGGASKRNYQIVVLLGLITCANVLYHLAPLGIDAISDRAPLYLLLHLFLILITVMGGRIIPAFSGNWLRAKGSTTTPHISPAIESLIIPVTAAAGIADSFWPATPVTGILLMMTATIHGLRLARWKTRAVLSEPLLAVLHIAYLWFVFGYALLGLSSLGAVFPRTLAIHALAMGGIGGMIVAIGTRVGLAHTGRALHVARLTILSYLILGLAVVMRVFGPLTDADSLLILDISAFGWITAFVLFAWVYWPMLCTPRVDGQPER